MVEGLPHLRPIFRASEKMSERKDFVCLDRNERVTPFPESVFRAFLGSLGPECLSTYPDPSPLCERIARAEGLPADHVYATPGSDAAIRKLFHVFLRPGGRAVFPDPTYAMYAVYTEVFGGSAAPVPYGRDLALDIDVLLAAIGAGARIVALANPDQPTGAVMASAVVERIVRAAREAGALCIVDEAYYPFHPQTVASLVPRYDNLAVTRSFSKVGGLAGLRVGAILAQPALLDWVEKIRGAHEVNGIAIAAACHVLDHPEIGHAMLREVEAGRAVLAEAAARLDLLLPSCPTNFQLLRFADAEAARRAGDGLRGEGYLVKYGFGAPSVADCIRVTLADPSVMEGFAAALARVAGAARPGDTRRAAQA